MDTLKIIASLLTYPDAELQAHADDLISALNNERLLKGKARTRLVRFIRELAEADLMDAQAYYIDSFDRGRSLSLHLFEHVHGESRDRGQAMVDLQDMYRAHGLEIGAIELPDYLPLFLEFCSLLKASQAREWLGDVEHILQLLQARLLERENRYAAVMGALISLLGKGMIPDALKHQARVEQRDDTCEALDRIWQEPPVSFGGGSCSTQCVGQASPLAAGDKEASISWVDGPAVSGIRLKDPENSR